MLKYCDIRKNSISGHLELDEYTESSVTFSEWWNGEGLDFTFYSKGSEDKIISLHINDIEMIALSSLMAGFLDPDELLKKKAYWEEKQKNKDRLLKQLGSDF